MQLGRQRGLDRKAQRADTRVVPLTTPRRTVLLVVLLVAAGTSLIAIDRLGAEEPAVDAATPTAAAPPAAVPGPTPTTRDAAAPTAGADSFEGDTLPTDSQFDLPPMLLIQLPSSDSGDPKVLGRSVLRSRSLALSPAARRDIRSGRVSVEGLKLLVELGPIEAPLLVHRARGSKLRVQATSLDGTRKLVRSIADRIGRVSGRTGWRLDERTLSD